MRHLGFLSVLVGAACSASPGSRAPGTPEGFDGAVDEAEPDAAPRLDASVVRDARPADTGLDTRQPSSAATDARASDGAPPEDADASDACSVSGAPGACVTLAACAALADHTSFAGYCPGPASIECCIVTPSTANNPPTPAGYELMAQSQVTSAMTAWAVMILDDPTMYPMFSTAMQTFGAQPVLARVEWHPPDFQNSVVHRGVTLYVPT